MHSEAIAQVLLDKWCAAFVNATLGNTSSIAKKEPTKQQIAGGKRISVVHDGCKVINVTASKHLLAAIPAPVQQTCPT